MAPFLRMTVAFAVAASLAGCLTPPVGPPVVRRSTGTPAVAGPVFEVAPTAVDAVAGAPAPDGRVHLLVRPEDSQRVEHVVVGPDGVEQHATLPTQARGSIAVAFQGDVLHAVVGGKHLSWRAGAWTDAQAGPACEHLVRAGGDLFCGYRERGSRLGTGWRIDVWPLMIPIPVPQTSRKVALACLSPNGWVDVAVAAPTTKDDALDFMMAGDDAGAIEVLFTRYRQIIVSSDGVVSARLPPAGTCEERVRAGRVAAIDGNTIFGSGGQSGANYIYDVATDARSGSVMIVGGFANGGLLGALFRGGDPLEPPVAVEIEDPRLAMQQAPRFTGPVRVRAAGDDRFHVLLADWRLGGHVSTLYHLVYRSGAWSPPLAVGDTRTWIMHNHEVQLVAGPTGRALAVWPQGKALRARWLSLPP